MSYVRQSLTVVLCLADDEVSALSQSLSALSTCPSLRLDPWSAGSMHTAVKRSLAAHLSPQKNVSTHTQSPTVGAREAATTVRDGATGRARLWPGATHVNLVGALAFGRFQSTTPAAKDAAPEGPGAVTFERDVEAVFREADCLFGAWMVLVEPACVEVFRAVEAWSGGGVSDGDGEDVGSLDDKGDHRWTPLESRCFRAVAEEGRGPRGASVEEVLVLFKHICRLGCRR